MPATDDPRVEWRTVASAALGRDTLYVRASWLSHEPASGESTYVGYRVQDAGGRVWVSDTIPDLGYGGWCDPLTCGIARWKSGLVVTLTATYWPCYQSHCERSQFIYLAERNAARSSWTDIQWDPAAGDSAMEWRQEDCIAYALPLVTRIVDRRLEWDYPSSTKTSVLKVRAERGECTVNTEMPAPWRIAAYSTADDMTPDTISVRAEDGVEVTSALIHVSIGESGTVFTEVRRVEITLAGRRLFADPGVLLALGYSEF